MPGALRPGPILTPAGHAGEDQRGIGSEARIRTDAQPLHDAGTERVDQHVVPLHEPEHHRRTVWMAEVQGNRLLAPIHRSGGNLIRSPRRRLLHAVDLDYRRPHVGEQHACKGSWPLAGQLEDRKTRERPRRSTGTRVAHH